jgi:3'-5' exoribonuclease
MNYTPLNKIKINQTIDQIFYISDVSARKTKKGKPFTILSVKDAEGTDEIKIWGFDALSNPELKPQSWARIICNVKEYQGRPDLSTENPPTIVPKPEDISPYTNIKGLTDEEIEAHWSYLVEVMDSVKNAYLKEYLNVSFADNNIQFKTAAASSSNRGAYRGGLVEHVAKVMKNALMCLAIQLESKYVPEFINRDVIIAAVMMHDYGKIYTYNVGEIETIINRCGKLIEHLPLSYALSTQAFIAVESNIRREVPEALKDHVNHCILAHHGKKEFGSPVTPASIEAYIVHIADVMDSHTSCFAEDSMDGIVDELGFVKGSFFSSRNLFIPKNNES